MAADCKGATLPTGGARLFLGGLQEELLMCEQQHDDLQREYLAVTAILEDQRLGLDPIKEEESDAPTPAQAAPSDQSAGRLEGQVQQENLA